MNSNISAREQEVLHLIAFEHNSREIAEQLYISEHTVITHRKNLILKLDVRNSAGLIRRAFEMGLLKIGMAVVLLMILTPTILSAQDIIYVDHQATDTEDGSTWPKAFRTLNAALDIATAGDSILISEGTYTPPDTSRNASFFLKDKLTVIGGFDPHNNISEYSDIIRFSLNEVILSGDIGIKGDSSDNSYHVIMNEQSGALNTGSRLVGLSIVEGNADGTTQPEQSYGGGIYVRGGSLEIRDCDILDNTASIGSAIYADSTSLKITNSSIRQNKGANGTIVLLSSKLVLAECSFTSNTSTIAGAIYALDSDISLIDSDFKRNSADYTGGAIIFDGATKGYINRCKFHENTSGYGGAFFLNSDSLTSIINSIITLNYASIQGGGIYLASAAKVEIINSNINYNTSNIDEGGGIYNSESDCKILNSLICCNNPGVSIGVAQNYDAFNPINSAIGHSLLENSGGSASWLVSNTTDLGGNIDDELMYDWDGLSDTTNQFIDCASPLINKGSNDYNTTAKDLGEMTRVIQDTIDIGAQEYQNDETIMTWTGQGDGIHWHDPANWSCPRLPNQFDHVYLESARDTIVIDTVILAKANIIQIANHCALLVKGDTINQSFGRILTNGIILTEAVAVDFKSLKTNTETDSAFLINNGVIEIFNDGLKCNQYCLVSNTYTMELNNKGIELILRDKFINEGLLNINIELDDAIRISFSESGGAILPQMSLPQVNLYNSIGAEINVTGKITGPTDQSSGEDGIVLSGGQVLNEGTINMRKLSVALLLNRIENEGRVKSKNNGVIGSKFVNAGVINILNSKTGINGKMNASFVNNGEINGQNLWDCPLVFYDGFDYWDFGLTELGN